MKHLIHKEITLASAPITWIFLAASLLTLVPGYPILISAFFICFGIFQSFQNGRETNDVLYTVLLPVRKRDYVAAKYSFVALIQMIGFLICGGLTVLRMTALSQAEVYQNNALMNASPAFLAFVLLIFAAFNVLFVGGYFKTAYKIGMPFLRFGIVTLLLVFAGESLHFFPGMRFFNTTYGERLPLQFGMLAGALLVYTVATQLSYRASARRFEKLDL